MELYVNEYAPQAKVIFVKRFQEDREVTESDVLAVASNVGEVHEISSINIETTVKNSPGSFSLTIMDTNNKFIVPDEPEKEIPALFRYSKRRSQRSVMTAEGQTKIVSNQDCDPACLYEFNTFDSRDASGNSVASGDKSWLAFNHIFITSVDEADKGMKYTTSYIRDSKSGEIFERWACDTFGRVIILCKSNAEEVNLQNAIKNNENKSSFEWSCRIVEKGKEKSEKVTYTVTYKSNLDFLQQYKDTEEQGDESYSTFKKGRCIISPMDRVVIFLSERFCEKGKVPNLVRAFTGVVSTVQEEYSENKNTISIRGEDVTKYLQLSIININPAYKIDENNPIDQMPGENITLWSNLLSGYSITDIVEAMTVGKVKIGKEGSEQYIDGVGEYRLALQSSKTDYIYDSESDTWKRTKNRANSSFSKASFKDALGDLFSKNSVHIYDIFNKGLTLRGFDTYRLGVNTNISLFQADFKTRREILFRCAEDANFSFYADRNGDIWFRPQRFDISHILLDDKGIYVIQNTDIINCGFLEDDGRVFTSVYVQTDPPMGWNSIGILGGLAGSVRDETAILKYGIRIFTTSNPVIKQQYDVADLQNAGEDASSISDNARAYAKSLLQRFLASRYQGQVSIPGRVELEPGNPVYIPFRNRIYYVESVQHSFTYGGSFTTTLHLNYGRKPWDQLAELLTYSEKDDMFLSDGYLYSDVVDTSEISDVDLETDPNVTMTYNENSIDNMVPYDNSPLGNPSVLYGHPALVSALTRVKNAIAAAETQGITEKGWATYPSFTKGLVVNEIYRSYAEQERYYNRYRNGESSTPAAKPGTSLHQQGLAVDINTQLSCDGRYYDGLLPFMKAEGFVPLNQTTERHHFVLESMVDLDDASKNPSDY